MASLGKQETRIQFMRDRFKNTKTKLAQNCAFGKNTVVSKQISYFRPLRGEGLTPWPFRNVFDDFWGISCGIFPLLGFFHQPTRKKNKSQKNKESNTQKFKKIKKGKEKS